MKVKLKDIGVSLVKENAPVSNADLPLQRLAHKSLPVYAGELLHCRGELRSPRWVFERGIRESES